MNKIPRFMKEYANFQKQSICNGELIKQEIKDKATENVDKALRTYERGLITINEAMKLIMNCLK